MNINDKIVITGIGIVSPLGHDTESTWQALLDKKSGIDEIRSFDASQFPTRIAAEVKNFQPNEMMRNNKRRRYATRFTYFASSAVEQAFSDAGIAPTEQTAERWGLIAGSGMVTSEFDYWSRFHSTFAKEGDVNLAKLGREGKHFYSSPEFGMMQPNCVLGLLLQKHNIQGYSTSVHTACASSGQALGLALQVMRRNDADYMLVGGFDSMINPTGLSSFCLLGALSSYNEEPQAASRPFDLTRNGFVLGEGAAFMILERYKHAKARGAKMYAELAGRGNSLSSYRITDSHPSGDGAKQAIVAALNDAGETVESIDYINAHGTSTKMNDLSETNAIKSVFGERASCIPVSSTKGQTGHLIAAAGALEAAVCSLAIDTGRVPMTANINHPDPDCDLDYVVEGPRQQPVTSVLSNSFGFGGSNSCVVFRHPDKMQ